MQFESQPIKGKGRGKKIGVPTINLRIPDNFSLDEGIYAVWVGMEENRYRGALHFGPIPAFNELEQSLEVNLLDADSNMLVSNKVVVEIVEKIRDIQNFETTEDLVKQIEDDIKKIRQILKDT